MKAQHQSHIAW